jgi:hypothetical protein
MIYLLWLYKNHQPANTAFAKITPEEDKVLAETFSDAEMERFGAKLFLYCESAWANEEYRHWGITTYPDIQLRIEHTRVIDKAGWFRFADMFTLMGTLDMEDGIAKKPDFPNPIYHLYIMQNNPVAWANYARLTKEEEAEMWAKWKQSIERTGACMMLHCKSAWSSEGMPGFGVVAFPSIEARQAHAEDLGKLNWQLYFDVFTLLGIASL